MEKNFLIYVMITIQLYMFSSIKSRGIEADETIKKELYTGKVCAEIKKRDLLRERSKTPYASVEEENKKKRSIELCEKMGF